MPGALVVCPTPIGNLEDITRRAERVLATADLVVCEDRRVTSRLLRHLGLRRPLGLYHEHNAERARPGLLAVLPVCSVLVGGRASSGGDEIPPGAVVEVLPPFAGG